MPNRNTGNTKRGGAALPLLAEVLRPAHWTASALCAQADPEAWFPEKGQSPHPAKAICRTCPVRLERLTEALTNGERFGIWGGLTGRERQELRRRRRGHVDLVADLEPDEREDAA